MHELVDLQSFEAPQSSIRDTLMGDGTPKTKMQHWLHEL